MVLRYGNRFFVIRKRKHMTFENKNKNKNKNTVQFASDCKYFQWTRMIDEARTHQLLIIIPIICTSKKYKTNSSDQLFVEKKIT
jgi:hypothetical protein